MTHDPTPLPSAPASDAAIRPGRGAWRRRWLVGAAFAATFAAGALATTVAPAAAGAAAQAGMTLHGANPAAMHAMMEAHLDKMLVSVGASADQSARIHAIFASAMGTLGPMHGRMAGAHAQLHSLLTAPTIDRAALEQARAQHLADFDQASKVLVGALADAAEVLTPAQRVKLGAEMAAHGHGPMGLSSGGM